MLGKRMLERLSGKQESLIGLDNQWIEARCNIYREVRKGELNTALAKMVMSKLRERVS